MRIPMPDLSFYLGENENKVFAEGNKATPVDGSARLRASLPDYLPEQWRLFAEDRGSTGESTERVEPRRHRRGSQGQGDGQAGGTERRKEERRKTKLPVLLDTRLTRCRRASSRFSAINFAI